jgi:8-oxo-dGTP pyrophosphatase MutT (NUDIX family)
VVPAAYVLLVREMEGRDQLLLQLRRDTGYYDGYWAAAAGHVESGESVLEAAVREVAEELGVVVDPADLEPLTVMHRTGGNGLPIDQFLARQLDLLPALANCGWTSHSPPVKKGLG